VTEMRLEVGLIGSAVDDLLRGDGDGDETLQPVVLRCSRYLKAALAMLGLTLLIACSQQPRISQGNTPQQQRAMAMWQERCKKSGEFIHRTVEGVEGVYLEPIRK
jgi:hypothetical protein